MTTAVRRTPPVRRPATRSLGNWFKQWLEVKDENEILTDRQGTLRDRIVDAVQADGEVDENGNVWYQLPSPISFTNHKGETKVFSSLKAERHLRPAQPLPQPDLAEGLLRKEGLWLSDAQEKAIRQIQATCPYATITVDVDVDALAGAYFKGLVTEADYEATLTEQKESFQFRPAGA